MARKRSSPRVKLHNGSVTLAGMTASDLSSILTAASLWRSSAQEAAGHELRCSCADCCSWLHHQAQLIEAIKKALDEAMHGPAKPLTPEERKSSVLAQAAERKRLDAFIASIKRAAEQKRLARSG